MPNVKDCPGCYAAYPAVQAASGTLFQSRLNRDSPPFLDFLIGLSAASGRCLFFQYGKGLSDGGAFPLFELLGRKLLKRLFQIVRLLGFEDHDIPGRMCSAVFLQGKINVVFPGFLEIIRVVPMKNRI